MNIVKLFSLCIMPLFLTIYYPKGGDKIQLGVSDKNNQELVFEKQFSLTSPIK